jgi:hypothetical protein
MNILLNVIDLVCDARGHAEAGQVQDVVWLLEAIEADLLMMASEVAGSAATPPEMRGQDCGIQVPSDPVVGTCVGTRLTF